MGRVKALGGIRFDTSQVDLIDVVRPSYDLVGEKSQKRHYTKTRSNVMNYFTGVDERDIDYSLLNETFRRWLEKEAKLTEDKPSFYFCEQDFIHPISGDPICRRSLLSTISLSEQGEKYIFPHENTFERAVQDRVEVLKQCPVNFDPMLAFYQGGTGVVDQAFKSAELITEFKLTDYGNIRYYRLSDPVWINKIEQDLADSKIFIADGHHRYESARRFYKEYLEQSNRKPAGVPPLCSSLLTALIPADDPGLILLPTHRLLREVPDNFFELLSAEFEMFEINASEVGHGGVQEFDLIGKDFAKRMKYKGTFNGADVGLFREVVIEKILQYSDHQFEESLAYTDDAQEACSLVQKGAFAVAFILQATPIQTVINYAERGEVMPQKATYFYPKPVSGFVFQLIGSLQSE